jgi:glutathione-independent formaldehyde dehydrogenase
MEGNRAVAYKEPGVVEIIISTTPLRTPRTGLASIPANVGRKYPTARSSSTVATNICGSDQHMVRGRTTAPKDLVLGHEITGEVVEVGPDVEFIKVGDIVSVPFNISCGRCRNCKERKTGICLNVNPDRPGSAYGYVDMGGWVGGQANTCWCPTLTGTCSGSRTSDQALEKILDLTMLSDIFPTGFHGAVTAGVGVGSTVYIAGAGPVGLAAASARSCWVQPS